MKGRTTCPKCKHEFVLDVTDDSEKLDVVCPKCDNKFAIKAKNSVSKSGDDFSWEEHGEPRKTILSSIKTKTNRPMIAAILLSVVFAIGITTAIFPETFIESSMNIASEAGITGTIEISVTDQINNSLGNISVKINGESYTTDENGLISAKNIKLGIQTLELSGEGYKTQTHEILVAPLFSLESTIKMEEGDGQGSKVNFDATGCTLILAVFSVFALLGAITCLKRQHLDVAIVGSFVGILSFGFFFVGSILGIIAFVLITKSKEEFENGKKGKIF